MPKKMDKELDLILMLKYNKKLITIRADDSIANESSAVLDEAGQE